MEIVLIRHGQPEWVRDGLNVVDPPLTELGLMQADCVGRELGGATFDEIIVSPLRRARQTAQPLRTALGHDEHIEAFLEEIREPNWHGTPAELSRAAYAEERTRPSEERWHGLQGGGEPPRDFVERVRAGAVEYWASRGLARVKQTLPRYAVDGTPAIIVNGKYRVMAMQGMSMDRMLEVTDKLIARERAAKQG